MSRTATINIYTVKELSEEARQKAYYNWCGNNDYPWGEDNENTLKEFEKVFPIKIRSWEYGDRGEHISFIFEGDEDIENLTGIRLMKYIYNNYYDNLFKGKYYSKVKYVNGTYTYKHRYSKIVKDNCCVLTGYSMDYDILQPIYDYLKKPDNRTFKELLDDCLQSWLKACSTDYEDYYSWDSFLEESEVNEWEYTENGDIF